MEEEHEVYGGEIPEEVEGDLEGDLDGHPEDGHKLDELGGDDAATKVFSAVSCRVICFLRVAVERRVAVRAAEQSVSSFG